MFDLDRSEYTAMARALMGGVGHKAGETLRASGDSGQGAVQCMRNGKGRSRASGRVRLGPHRQMEGQAVARYATRAVALTLIAKQGDLITQ